MARVFIVAFYLTVIVNDVLTRRYRIRGSKRQVDEDRWEWGYVDETGPITAGSTMQPRVQETTTLGPEADTPPSFCQPYDVEKPNFNKPGRRISEAKCYEYIWELNKRLEIDKREAQCLKYNSEKLSVQFAIGGFCTGPGDYPHMGALGWKASVGTWVFKCGSSLISERFVVTAAHCTKASLRDTSIADPVPKIVRLGDKNIIDSFYNGVLPTDISISRIIVHPQYSPPRKYFDIALMELESEVQFSKLLQPACLWSSFSTRRLGSEATLTGWGVVETSSLKISPELRGAIVDILDSQQCDDLLRTSCNRNWCGMQDHQICAGKLAGGVDACQGDSGGPLQVKIPLPSNSQGQMHFVIGIISFGIGCAHPNLPGIYTRVSSFIDWIEDIVWRDQMK